MCLVFLAFLIGCGSPVADTPESGRKASPTPVSGDATEEASTPDAPDADDSEASAAVSEGNSAAPEETAVAKLERIAAKLNREGHDHSLCEEGLALAGEALRENPDFALAYAVRGDIHAQHGDVKAALRAYHEAARLDRDNETYAQKLAVYYEIDGQLEKALEVWEDVCRRFPNNWRNFYGRATMYDELGQDDKADADYQRASELQRRR